MAWTEVKAADLRRGDRVRVTVEGVWRGLNGSFFRVAASDCASAALADFTNEGLGSGKLEREERPLAVGESVRDPVGSHWEVIAPPRARDHSAIQEVCLWNSVTGYVVRLADDLERIPPQAERVAS